MGPLPQHVGCCMSRRLQTSIGTLRSPPSRAPQCPIELGGKLQPDAASLGGPSDTRDAKARWNNDLAICWLMCWFALARYGQSIGPTTTDKEAAQEIVSNQVSC